MTSFIFLNIFLISAGIGLFIVIRALPRTDGTPPPKRSVIERWMTSEMPERLDKAANSVLSRFMRKTRVLVLRLDNSLTKQIGKMGSETKAKEERDEGFKGLLGEEAPLGGSSPDIEKEEEKLL